ncbi:MAG: DUF763 domain-containing protein, partial [Chitinispirillaceae bacterium]|nr:DUF763 domain-containing protein [Chitinispirillaceae bacterium]
SLSSFLDDPHTAIIGKNMGKIMNLSDSRALDNRKGIVEFLSQHPEKQMNEFRHIIMGKDHRITQRYVDAKRLGSIMALAYEKQYQNFVEILLLPGVGPRCVQSLALVSEIIYGAPCRFSDPARFAFAHGGKDGHPFPVPLKVYDECIETLRKAVNAAKIGINEKLHSIKALHRMALSIEKNQLFWADVDKISNYELKHSAAYGGMTIFDRDK